jgi:putative PIN family toxin of toxin-antitoxin system
VTSTTPIVVIDTNLLVRALIGGPGSSPLLQAWQAQRIHLAVCQETLEELAEVLARPRLQKYFTQHDVQELLFLLRQHGMWVQIETHVKLCRDPKDDLLLNLAISAGARYLVSADKDLIDDDVLQETMEREYNVKVMDVPQFIASLERDHVRF